MKTIEKYNLGKLGNLELINYKNKSLRGVVSDNLSYSFIVEGKTIKELENNLFIHLITDEKLIDKCSKDELKKISSSIKRNGLEKTSQDYRTLQNKKAEGGN